MRPDRVIAGTALLLVLAMVVVPDPVGSRTPGPDPTVPPQQLQGVLSGEVGSDGLASGVPPGSATYLPDSAWQSEGLTGPGTILNEPAPAATPSRPPAAQPAPIAGTILRNPWRFDGDISWYGPGFYGRRPACGRALTESTRGVAHRTLPCGTLVTFRNPANGRTITVPVIDRGPYVDGRTWDMTGGTCTYLGHCYTGSIEWRYVIG